MTPASWARISELFDQAIAQSPTGRAALLAELHRTDAAAARELASLLEAHDRPGEFLPDLPAAPEPADLTGRIVGAYRLLMKWRPPAGGNARAVRRRLRATLWCTIGFFLLLGGASLAAYMRIGSAHAERAGERYVPAAHGAGD